MPGGDRYRPRMMPQPVTDDDPWGLPELAGVGDLVPAAKAQLHLDPADQIRAARVRPAPPPHAAAGRDAAPGRMAQEEAR